MMLLLLALAADPAPQVQVEVAPKEGAWVGQRIDLIITLKTPDLFAGAPVFEMPPIPGAVVLPPAGSPIVGSEKIDEDTFTTQRHEFAVYAQRPGSVRIAPFPIRFETNAGFGKPVIQRALTTKSIEFEARTPPGAEKLGTVIAARSLKVTEEWNPDRKAFKVGDSITYTMTITADGIPGMVFPPIRFNEIDGLSVYAKDPVVNDHTERGSLTGTRTDSAVYICQEAGNATMAGRTLTWFDLDTRTLKHVDLTGRTFEVTADVEAPSSPPAAEYSRWPWIASALGAFAVLVVLLVLRSRYASTHEESEAELFTRVLRACRSNDAHAAYSTLLTWLEQIGQASLDASVARLGDPVLSDLIIDLRRRLFSKAPAVAGWEGGSLLQDRMKVARSLLLRPATPPEVPDLNPMSC